MGKYLELAQAKAQTILIVNLSLTETISLSARLQQEGFVVYTAGSAAEAVDIIELAGLPQLAIIDLDLLFKGDVTLVAKARLAHPIPLIFIISLSNAPLVKKGLAGFTNYQSIFRPIELNAFISVVYAALRLDQSIQVEDKEFIIDARLRVNFARKWAALDEQSIKLSPIENYLLYILYCHRGHYVSPEQLRAQLSRTEHNQSLRALRSYLSRLRDKLEAHPGQTPYIITARGKGYRLGGDDSPQATDPLVGDDDPSRQPVT